MTPDEEGAAQEARTPMDFERQMDVALALIVSELINALVAQGSLDKGNFIARLEGLKSSFDENRHRGASDLVAQIKAWM